MDERYRQIEITVHHSITCCKEVNETPGVKQHLKYKKLSVRNITRGRLCNING